MSAPGQAQPATRRFDARRLAALVRKESLQALRDPSTLLIAFVLPTVLLFLFAYAVSLDIRKVRIGVVVESPSVAAQQLRSEEHTSELQSLMRISYAVFCLKKKTITPEQNNRIRILENKY